MVGRFFVALLVALGPACSPDCERGPVRITSRVVWRDWTCRVESLVIEGDGELVLEHATIAFDPRVEDTDAFQLRDRGRFHAEHGTLESANEKQWNMQAFDDAVIELVDTTATEHTGLRNFDRVHFSASGNADIEEVQVHDDAIVRMQDGTAGYVVLFFTGGVSADLAPGELVVGEGQARTLAVPTGPTTSGTLELAGADVYGWQIDLENDSSVNVAGGEEIVLALHLTDVSATVTDDVTTDGPSTGMLDFSDQGGPRFAYTDSTIASFNVYAAGASQIAFTGRVDVTEPNAEGTSRVLFGPGTTMYANLAQTYESAQMTFDGVKLAIDGDDGSSPSFTADDASTITIVDVVAIDGTYLGAVGGGRVLVQGGSHWDVATAEDIDVDGAGGVYLDGDPL